MAKLPTCLGFLAVILVTAIAVKPPKTSTAVTNDLVAERVTSVAQTQQNLKRKVSRLTAQSTTVTERLTAIEQQLETHEELATVKELLIQCEAKNQQLMTMLSNFERFFGSLYVESPESFDPTEAVDVRMSKLNSYLGNREAELLSLRPAPTTIVGEDEVNQELLGNALYEMEEQRTNWDKKLRKLEERLARVADRTSNNPHVEELLVDLPEGDVEEVPTVEDQPMSGARPGLSVNNVAHVGNKKNNTKQTPCNCRTKRSFEDEPASEVLERLERLENLMVLQLLPLLNDTIGESSFRGLNSPSDALYNLTQLVEIEEEIAALRANKPDSKKVAFSVARTTHMFGQNQAQIVEFDHIFLNKGGHFKEDNSTFICGVTGFYFVTFTVRSFDGYVLGIILMKNDDHVSSIFTDADERNVMETQSVIVHLEKGDQLWLRHPPSERFAIHSDRYRYTTFSAFLVFKGN